MFNYDIFCTKICYNLGVTMAKTKEDIRVDLIIKAREMIQDKGLEFLTARKLSDYSGYSVGTIYNQFKSMDNLVMWENCLTLDELIEKLNTVEMSSDVYKNLNRLIDKFVDFVLENKNLWFTLYNFHFKDISDKYAVFYLRRILKIVQFLESNLSKLFTKISANERKVSTEVLFTSLFAISSLLTSEREFQRLSKKYVVRVMFNTYLAGMSLIEQK